MRVNPLNDLIHKESDQSGLRYYFTSQERPVEEEREKKEDNNSDNSEDIRDNIFLFLD